MPDCPPRGNTSPAKRGLSDTEQPGLASRIASVFARTPKRFRGRKPRQIAQATDRKPLGESPESLASSVPFDWGRSTGWLESNQDFTVEFLHGSSKSPGKLLEIRRTDDVIAPAVDSRREMMAGLEYGVRPRARLLKDPMAQQAAIEVRARLESMPGTSLPWQISEAYDHWFTSGFNLDEIVLDWANRVSLRHVRPGLIQQFNQDDTGRGWESVQVRDRFSFKTVGEHKFAYTPRLPQPGEFYGDSGLRCMVATSETTLQLYTALLQAVRYSMGFPYLSETGNGMPTAADKNNAMKALSSVMGGNSDIAYFGKKIEPNILSSQTPAMQLFVPLAQHQTERKQGAARNALSNLGMRGVGSRSLGETVLDADMAAVKGHLDLFMRNYSGEGQSHSSLMHKLAELSGYDPYYAPEFYIDWNAGGTERLALDHLQLVADLKASGGLTNQPGDEAWLRDQLRMNAGSA